MSTASLPPKTLETPPPEPLSRHQPQQRVGWLEERLDLHAIYVKYGRKVFPVHHTFFLGEMVISIPLSGLFRNSGEWLPDGSRAALPTVASRCADDASSQEVG